MTARALSAVIAVSLVSLFFVFFSFAGEPTSPSPVLAVESHHPRNWRFTLPEGDPVKGKAVFEKFECHYCHEIRGEHFPAPAENAPELSQMGGLHPLEFFAESIMNPNAVVPKAYRKSDGKSPMTDFTDKMTVKELIDVSVYLASLRPKGAPKTVSAQGEVIALVPERNEIVLAHGEIKGFMDAMTMGYKVSSPTFIKTLKPGDRVQFTMDTAKRVITKVTKLQGAREKKQ